MKIKNNQCTINCPFCNDEMIPKIFFKTKYFKVIPSIGPLKEGHLLIITKKHFTSIAKIPLMYFHDLKKIYSITRNLLSKLYSEPIFFEHGTNTMINYSGQSIVHAHIHILPASINLSNKLRQCFLEKKISFLHDLKSRTEKQYDYLFFENNNREKFVYIVKDKLPSQYLRRIIAESLGNGGMWNWKEYPLYENVERTMQKITHHILQNNCNS